MLLILVECSIAEQTDPGLLIVEEAQPGLEGAADAAEERPAAPAVVLPAAAPQAQLGELLPAKIILKPQQFSESALGTHLAKFAHFLRELNWFGVPKIILLH